MCGLAVIFDTDGQRPINNALLESMTQSLWHRGPDSGGKFTAPGVGLGHRRLSIIDLTGGDQPLFNEDGTVCVVYNGEIYNFKELFQDLTAHGHRFKTRCDTEVIVHAWEQWGPACVDRFRGMFAFVLWDDRTKTLFAARDRLGIKPLFYTTLADGRLLIASELKALLRDPSTPRDIDPIAVEEYLAYGYVPDPRTIYTGVHKLPPAHTLVIKRGSRYPSIRAYWDVTFRHNDGRRSPDQIDSELVAHLREAVDIRMMSEVPLGAFLSGGVDSSAVVAMMAGLSEKRVEACSIGFGEASFDESRYARQLAERYNCNQHTRRVDPTSFDLVDRLAQVYDEPFADSSAMPTYLLCGLARERVTVALSGDGGDELFAGYRRHRWHHYEELVRSRVPGPIRRPFFGMLGTLYPKLDWAPKVLRARTTLHAISLDSVEAYFGSVSVVGDAVRNRITSPDLRHELRGYHPSSVIRAHMDRLKGNHHLDRIQYCDFKTYLPGDILTKVDRASMAHSLEVRVPILDHLFVEHATKLPPDQRLRKKQGKYAFKRALEPHVSPDILYRPKMGFGVPLATWFRGPLADHVEESLGGRALAESGIFDSAYVRRLVQEHKSGRRDHSTPIWSLVMFESFLRNVHLANPEDRNTLGANLPIKKFAAVS